MENTQKRTTMGSRIKNAVVKASTAIKNPFCKAVLMVSFIGLMNGCGSTKQYPVASPDGGQKADVSIKSDLAPRPDTLDRSDCIPEYAPLQCESQKKGMVLKPGQSFDFNIMRIKLVEVKDNSATVVLTDSCENESTNPQKVRDGKNAYWGSAGTQYLIIVNVSKVVQSIDPTESSAYLEIDIPCDSFCPDGWVVGKSDNVEKDQVMQMANFDVKLANVVNTNFTLSGSFEILDKDGSIIAIMDLEKDEAQHFILDGKYYLLLVRDLYAFNGYSAYVELWQTK